MANTVIRSLSIEAEFKRNMIRFYRACQIPEGKIKQVMRENNSEISKYLMATPELMARKFYYRTFNVQL